MTTSSVVRHWFGDGWSPIRYQVMGCSFTKNEMLYAYDNIYATILRIGVYWGDHGDWQWGKVKVILFKHGLQLGDWRVLMTTSW